MGSKEFLRRRHVAYIFEESQREPGNGSYISYDPLNIGAVLLHQHLSSIKSRILVANCDTFSPTFSHNFSLACSDGEQARAKTIRLLLRRKKIMIAPWKHYIALLKKDYDCVLMPYNLRQDHFVVFEVVWRSGRGQYVKVWDGMNMLGLDGRNSKEVRTILDVFFEGEQVPVYVREPGDPVQEVGFGCGPFAFLVMCYLALGHKPRGWTSGDEGVARNYLAGCLFRGKVLPLPRMKFV